jgi:hypothetical protein
MGEKASAASVEISSDVALGIRIGFPEEDHKWGAISETPRLL